MKSLRLALVSALAAALACPPTSSAVEKPEKTAEPKPAATETAPAAVSPAAVVEQLEEMLEVEGDSPDDEKAHTAFWTKQLAKVDALIADFRARFPADPLRFRVLMLEANAREMREHLELPLPKGSRPAAEIYAEIAASPDADPEIKAEANTARLISLSDAVAEKKVPLTEWEKQLAAHLKAHPEFPANLMLVEMRLLMVSEHASARMVPLLEELSKDPNEEIAQLASGRLAAAKMMAELKSKPLDLKFKAFDGTEVDLEKLRGKVVLIDFWATWCGPCMAALPKVIKAREAHQAKGFEIVGISLDEDEAEFARVLKAKKITWPQHFDGTGWENAFAKKFGIEEIPTMWLVNKAGMVVDTEAQEGLEEKIAKLLAE